MINIAAHVRIFDPEPEDDLVTKRTSAIAELCSNYGKGGRQVLAIFQSANDLARAVEVKAGLSEALAREIETAVRKSASAFVADGNELQMTVCGLLGALQSLDGVTSSAGVLTSLDVFAIGLWSALSFQAPRSEPKLEALRVELLQKAREFTLGRATSTRRRINVPDASFQPPTEYEPTGLGESLKTGVGATIEALRANAAIDREELDLLWWVLSDWSELLGRRFSAADNPEAAAVASGLEAGRMLRRMPADAHRHLVLRHAGKTDSLNLTKFLKTLGADRERLAAAYAGDNRVTACPAIFPLITALRSGSATDPKGDIRRTLEEWAGRALLESAALHVTAHVPSVAV
jgi:hypothetical protein